MIQRTPLIRAISRCGGSAPRPVDELAKFHELATEEELGLLKGFAPSEQFTIKPLGKLPPQIMISGKSPAQIIQHVARYFHLRPAQLVGQGRKRHVADARWAAMHLIRTRFEGMSYAGIGTYFSNRDHSTVINAISQMRVRLEADSTFRRQYDDLAKSLNEVAELALVDV